MIARIRTARRLPTLGALATLGLLLLAPAAFAAPVISDAKVECVPNSPYPMIDATIKNAPEVARLYFRSDQGSEFYYVDMTGEERFQGVMLVPAPGTSEIVYYVEAVNSEGDARTQEFSARVTEESGCNNALLYLGADPGIVLHATAEGAAALPQGFLSSGVASSVTVSGVATPVAGAVAAAAGGGLGAGAIAGIAVGGAAGAVVIADELDDEGDNTTSPGQP